MRYLALIHKKDSVNYDYKIMSIKLQILCMSLHFIVSPFIILLRFLY